MGYLGASPAVCPNGNPGAEEMSPELLRYRDIPTVVETTISFMKANNDPLDRYLGQTPSRDDTAWKQAIGRLLLYTVWTKYVKDSAAFTIDAGNSYIISQPPQFYRPPASVDKIWYAIISALTALNRNKEQKKRGQEFWNKYQEAIRRNLGESASDMYHISGLGVIPEKQESGYTSALVQSVIEKVDLIPLLQQKLNPAIMASSENRAVALISTANNVAFYESFGFGVVDLFLLGNDNPTWKEDPVTISLMLREAQTAVTHEKDC